MGERLFDKFDRSSAGCIRFEDFIQSLSVCARGADEEKLQFLFELYDLRGDGYLDKQELVSMVSSIQVHNTYKQVHQSTSDLGPEVRSSSPSRRQEGKSSAALLRRDEFGSQEQVEDFVNKLLEDLTPEEHFDLEHFARFIQTHPRVMQVFMATFRENLWSGVSPASANHPSPKRCCCSSPRIHPLHTSTRASSLAGHIHEKAGWMWTKERDLQEPLRKVFVMLRNGMLLVYVNPGTALPSSVIFLEGCFLEQLKEQGGRFGFVISHQFESFQEVTFWCSQRSESDDWTAKLMQAAKTRRVEEMYEFRDRLGTGKFSDVYLAVELATGLHWAAKVVEKTKLNPHESEMLRSEVAIMRLLNHHNVVQMKEMYEDKAKIYLIEELVEGGELFDRIRQKKVFSEFSAFHMTRQLLETIKYLHDVGIIHRDIKPENILLSDDSDLPTIKLADFGLSKLVGPGEQLHVACGTIGYVAPEVLDQQPYGKEIDVWSMGVVLYLLLRGRLPFDSKDKDTVMQRTLEARLDLTGAYWSKLTPYVLDFLKKVLARDPEERLTVEQALEHSWIKNGEVLIPRKINRRVLDEDMMKKTITTAKMGTTLYSEAPDADLSQDMEHRVVYTTPDIFEDMEVSRRCAEKSLAINLLDSYVRVCETERLPQPEFSAGLPPDLLREWRQSVGPVLSLASELVARGC